VEKVEEENFDLHMRFIGTDLNYWEKLKERFEHAYDSLKIKYSLVSPQIDKFNPMNEYISLIEDDVNILFYEMIFDHQKSIDFIKFVRRDQTTKRISTTILHSFNATEEELSQVTTAGARINQIKSDEFSGVIFAAMSLYDTNKTEIPPLLFVPYEKDIEINQELRLSFLTKDYYSVETNSPFVPGTELTFENHPYATLLPPSCRFEVRSLSEDNLYYYKRYNLKLWPILEEPKDYEKRISKWISSTDDKIVPKKTKILLVDPYLLWFKEIDKSIKNLEFTVNFQTNIDLIDVVLKRRRPLIICLAIDSQDPNSIMAARRLMTKISSTPSYEPYVLIVNCPVPTETLKKSLNYEKIMGIRNLLRPAEMQSMAQSLEKKLLRLEDDDVEEKRTYFKSSNSKVKINYHRKIRLLGMTESMIYFQSDQVIPDYTVFTIDHPVRALLTTVPHFKVELKELLKPYYIGIINCTGESANSKLRNYLNTLIKESQEPDEPEESKENPEEESSNEGESE
jgi:hypothetical protein